MTHDEALAVHKFTRDGGLVKIVSQFIDGFAVVTNWDDTPQIMSEVWAMAPLTRWSLAQLSFYRVVPTEQVLNTVQGDDSVKREQE